jgi:abortive infection bacteriophage resistance protein
MRNLAGYFLMNEKILYEKPALTISDQIKLYQSRGLLISNPAFAASKLSAISYYRLSGYARYFTQIGDRSHGFIPGTTFEQIVTLYSFDKELRLLILDAIESIEVAVRTAINNVMSTKYTPHWLEKREYFKESAIFSHKKLKIMIEKAIGKRKDGEKDKLTQDIIFKSYYQKYHSPELPPCWMIAEAMSLGTWSFIYQNLRNKPNRQEIATIFKIPPKVLDSWLHCLTILRNLCAHHAIVWRRIYPVTPRIIYKKHPKIAISKSEDQSWNRLIYQQLAVLSYLLKSIDIDADWEEKLIKLLQKYKSIPIQEMGFPKNWYQKPFHGVIKE